MKVEISLKDERFCEGCPCMNVDYEQGSNCNLGYDFHDCWHNNKLNTFQDKYPFNDDKNLREDWDSVDVRPEKCIAENGK